MNRIGTRIYLYFSLSKLFITLMFLYIVILLNARDARDSSRLSSLM